MNYGMIIKLSGSKISFLYNKADKNGLFPFDGNRPILPLAILKENDELVIGDAALRARQTGSKNAYTEVLKDIKRQGTFNLKGKEHSYGDLLLLAVEKHLSDFMTQAYLLQGTTYEAVKSELPLGFIFNDCVSAADKEAVKNLFVSHGYQNIADIDVNTFLFQQYGRPNILVISGDGQDLSLKLYERESKEVKAQQILPGAGIDPRITAVAELFYNNLSMAGINKSKALPILEAEAAIVLEKNPSEYEGRVTIDGLSCEFFVTRREIEAAVAAIVGSAENLGIAEFVRNQNVDMADCTLFIQRSLADNSYFCKTLKGSFPDANLVDEKREKEVMKVIDQFMRENKFSMQALDADNNNTTGTTSTTVASDKPGQLDKLPKKNVKGTPYDTYIKFDILVPKDARYVELWRRDGGAPKGEEQLIERVLPTFDEEENPEVTTFTDSGLKELTPYMYNFVAVYFDEFGNELRTKDMELQYRTVPRVATNEKPIEVIVSNDDEQSATLKWNEQRGTKLKLYTDDEPYNYQSGDLITNETDIHGTLIDLDDKQYIVRKDFHGERFFLPVTVRNGIMTAGNPVGVQSNPRLRGFKTEYDKTADGVSISWEWGVLHDVMVVWQYPNDNRVPEKVNRNSNEGHVIVARTPQHAQVLVEVYPVFTSKVDGSDVKGTPMKRTVDIPQIGIDLTGVRDDGRGKFTCHIGCTGASRVPCDLRLLVCEGEANFDNPNATIDIKKEQWQQGRVSKQFDFNRKRATNDLYFRIEATDDDYAERLNFVRQEHTIDGKEEEASAPTFTEKRKPKKGPVDPPKRSKLPYIIAAIAAVVLVFFLYPKLTNGNEDAKVEVPGDTIPDTPPTDGGQEQGNEVGKGEEPTPPQKIDCTDISMQSSLTLTLGSQNTLNVSKKPKNADETIIWESSNPSVVSVNQSGKIVAQSEGTATITATTNRTKLEAQTSVTVKKLETTPPPPPPGPAKVRITTNIECRTVYVVINGQQYGPVPCTVELSRNQQYNFVARIMDKKNKKVEKEQSVGTITVTGDREFPIKYPDPSIFCK